MGGGGGGYRYVMLLYVPLGEGGGGVVEVEAPYKQQVPYINSYYISAADPDSLIWFLIQAF